MTDRELNEWADTEIMGWKRLDKLHYLDGDGLYVRDGIPFEPTTNASDDYEVLKHVRENWSVEQLKRFSNCLYGEHLHRLDEQLPDIRLGTSGIMYEPGDYTRAAWAALNPNTAPGQLDDTNRV